MSTDETPPDPSGTEAVSADDAGRFYRVFLGRRPESEAVVQEKVGHSLEELTRSFLGSDEFLGNVFQPVVDRRGWPDHLFRGPIEAALLDWAERRLQVRRAGRERLSGVEDWASLLLVLFEHSALLETAFEDRVEARAAFLSGLEASARMADKPHVFRKSARDAGLFDPAWYAARHGEAIDGRDPERFYFEQGWRLGHSPGPAFDARFYLQSYRDVADSDFEPLEHYVRHGALEGRLALRGSGSPIDESLPVAGEQAILALSPYAQGPASIAEALAEPLTRIAAELAPGRAVLEAGAATPRTLDRLVACRLAGASDVRLIEDRHVPFANGRLRATGQRLGAAAAVEAWLDRSAVRFSRETNPVWSERTASSWLLNASLFDRDLRNKAGPIGLLVVPAPIDGCREILRLLRRAEALTTDLVLLTARPTDPAAAESAGLVPDTEEIRFLANLDASMAPATDDAGLRWWAFGPGGLERLLAMSGLDLVRRVDLGDGQGTALVARKRRREHRGEPDE